MASTTLILGGGFGGISTAVELRKRAPKDHRIVLIDHGGELVIGATKPWVMLGEAQPKTVIHRLDPLAAHGIELIRAEITKIDADAKSVETSRGAFKGDFLVVALGADYDMSAVPGLAEAAHTYYTLEGAIKLRPVLEGFTEGTIINLIPRAPFKCPPAPYEGAFLLHDFFRRKGRTDKVRQRIVTVEGAPMATAGPEVGEFIKAELAKRNIPYETLKKIAKVDPAGKKVVLEDGMEIGYDLLIAVPPHRVPKVIKESALAGPNGWIPVDRKFLAVKDRPGIYALGDVAVMQLPGKFKDDAPPLVLPKAGTLADAAGKVVAANIHATVTDASGRQEFHGKGFCYVEMGDMHAMRGDGNFFDMPRPTMERKTPDMQQYQDKKKWISDWLKEHWLTS